MAYENIDPTTNVYFGPQDSGDGTSSLGSGAGYDFFNWFDPSLGDLGNLPFYTQATNSGDASQDASINPQELSKWLAEKNYSLQQEQNQGYALRQLYNNNTNKAIGNSQFYQTAPDWIDNLQFQLGAMFLSPFGGIAAGGATGGLGGAVASGSNAAAINGAAGAAMTTAGTGGSDKDIAKNAVAGGLAAGYTPDVAQYVGVTNPAYAAPINDAVKGGVGEFLGGGNFLEGFAKAGLPSAASSFGTQMGWDMPDEGTLGGTMQDEYGENSATLGGRASPAQQEANSNVATISQGESPSLMDKLNKTLSFSGNGEGGIGFSSQQFGNLAQSLAGLYAANKQRRMAKDLQNQIAGRRDAYSTQLQRQLARKDAASGRRSDYGGREVALQSALAQLDSANAPSLMNLQNAQMGGYVDMLKSGLSLGNSFGLFGNKSQPQMPASYSGQLPSLEANMPANYSLAGPQAQDYYTRGKIKLGGGN